MHPLWTSPGLVCKALYVGMTNSFEYLLRVEVLDLESYKRLHTDVLGDLPDVTAITTYVVLASPEDERS